ncbi:MAG: hypothetical protein JST92_06030 [Deltaproteobacteria bacterium]|nr:hypothetical protein [Deltaproteobacteria bacterium]
MGAALSNVDALREAFASLGRALKRIAVYRHARDQHASFVEPALQALRDVLDHEGAVTIEVHTGSLTSEGQTVYLEPPREWGLCFRLHRDGVRTLTFQRGITLDELLAFCNAALYDPNSGPGREDAVTELWKADFTAITYSATSGYRMEHGDLDADKVAEAVRKLAARARPVVLEVTRHASDLAENTVLDRRPQLMSRPELAGLDSVKWPDLARRAAHTLLRIVEEGFAGRDLEALEESLWRLIDELVARGEAQALARTLETLRRLSGQHAQAFRAGVARKLADPGRLLRLSELGGVNEAALTQAIPVWLALLPREAGNALLDVLPQAPAQTQQLFARAAIARAELDLERFARTLSQGQPAAVIAILAALDTLSPATRAELSTPALSHASARVRIEAVNAVGSDAETAVRELPAQLLANDPSVRVAAVQVLASCAGAAERAAALLISAIERPGFASLDREEQALHYRALGKLGSSSGFQFLCEQLSVSKGLFKKKPAENERLLAVNGLAEETSVRTLRALEQAAAPENGQPATVATAARAAVVRMRTPQPRGGSR